MKVGTSITSMSVVLGGGGGGNTKVAGFTNKILTAGSNGIVGKCS